MNSTTRSVDVDLTVEEAFELVRQAAKPLGYRETAAKPDRATVRWSRGFTLASNPQDCTATIEPAGDGRSTVTYKASVMALFDPFGFTRETADRFVHQLHAHIEARSSGQPPEAPRPARVGLIVNLVAIGFVLVLVVGGVGCFLAVALMDAL